MDFDIAASARRLRGLQAENDWSREKAAAETGISADSPSPDMSPR